MKKNGRQVFKKVLLAIFGLFFASVTFVFFLFVYETKGVKLDQTLFASSKNAVEFSILDSQGNPFDVAFWGDKNVSISDLPEYVKNAFIAVEDKRFYSHSGVDLKRIAGATIKNIKNKKFSEGASTITQQLIKNTHLSREKTITRKMKEVKLAISAERVFSKDKILEEYLNTIYFGNGAYGLENASNLYFSKSATNLTVAESATLAGVINAPRIYDPFANPENCQNRRDLVLMLMKNQGYISDEEYQKNAKTALSTVKNNVKTPEIAKKYILNEVCDVLKISENQLKNMRIKIKCNIDDTLQNNIDLMLQNSKYYVNGENNQPASIDVFVVENQTGKVLAVSSFGNSSIVAKRQPGSLIKPIFVYAPAIENGQISPESIVKDEPISIDNYSPQNASKTYSGNVSVRTAVEKSLNIPAVKILSNLGVKKAKDFATKLGIEFSNSDTNLALALGGMTYGVTIKQLADAYATFASDGEFLKSHFVSEIIDENGKVLYSAPTEKERVMKSSTAFLISDMLKGVTSKGTARRLAEFDFDLCSKTGTVGVSGSNKNSDAYVVCYTTEHTVVCHYGANKKSGDLPSSVNGSTYPVYLAKSVLNQLYSEHIPNDFEMPEDVVIVDLDSRKFKNGELYLARLNTPERYKTSAIFDRNNLPPSISEQEIFVPELIVEMESNQKPILKFKTKKGFYFSIVRTHSDIDDVIYQTNGDDEYVSFEDKTAGAGKIYEYSVLVMGEEQNNAKRSNSIKLMSY